MWRAERWLICGMLRGDWGPLWRPLGSRRGACPFLTTRARGHAGGGECLSTTYVHTVSYQYGRHSRYNYTYLGVWWPVVTWKLGIRVDDHGRMRVSVLAPLSRHEESRRVVIMQFSFEYSTGVDVKYIRWGEVRSTLRHSSCRLFVTRCSYTHMK